MKKHPTERIFYLFLTTLMLFALILSNISTQRVRAATIIYVKPVGSTSGACDSWGNACELQYALSLAVSGDELWVEQGTYKPTSTSDRNATFHLKSGVGIYGGFGGTETLREQRNWGNHITILSGEIGGSEISDNSYHVVTGSGTDSTAVLDGFTVTRGDAYGSDVTMDDRGGGMTTIEGSPKLVNIIFDGNSAYTRGGGMWNYYSSPILENVIFMHNSTDFHGGGMTNNHSNPTLVDVTFNANLSADLGGGMYNYYSPANLTNVLFISNSATNRGGGIFNEASNPILVNVTLFGNSASILGGGIYNTKDLMLDPPVPISLLIIHNSILWGNNPDQIFNDDYSNTTITHSDLQGACPDRSDCTTHVIYTDPQFVNPTTGDVRLSGTSPDIDAGDNTSVPNGTLFDLAGNPRFIDIPSIPDTGNGTPPIVDMGAYEHQAPIAVNDSYSTSENIQLIVSAPGVLGNDVDLNGYALVAMLDGGPANGQLTLNSDGSFVYTPTINFHGTDSFTYHANDGELDSNIATVTITVSHNVQSTTTTIDCGSGSPVVTYGSNITCVATVTRAAGNRTPSGTVSWSTNGGGDFTASSCTLSGSGGTATCSVSYTPNARGSGSHLITATYGGDSNFTGSSGNQTVTVNHRPITITADAKTKVVGQPDPILTYQITSGSLVFGDAFTGALTRDPGENVGTHPILQGTLVLNDNYTLTYIGANLTITNQLLFLPIIIK